MRNVLQTTGALWIVCVNRAGVREGAQLVEFIDDWRRCVNNQGGPVDWIAYRDWTRKYSQATAYRRLELFRKTFPQLGPDGTPQALMGPLLERLAADVEAES